MTLEFRVNPSILDDFDHVCNQKPTAVSASKHGPKSISGIYNLIGGFEWNCCCVHSNQKENFTSQFSQRRMILTGQYVKGFFPETNSNVPGLVNVYITMENHHFLWENSLYMAIFNSYVTNYQRVSRMLCWSSESGLHVHFWMICFVFVPGQLEKAATCALKSLNPMGDASHRRVFEWGFSHYKTCPNKVFVHPLWNRVFFGGMGCSTLKLRWVTSCPWTPWTTPRGGVELVKCWWRMR